jgi:hypothetical protein
MAIVRFNPFREMELMQRQMNRLFDEMAEFKDGILCLTLPKAEEEKNRVVTVNLLNGQTQSNGANGQSAQPEIPQAQTSQAPQAS